VAERAMYFNNNSGGTDALGEPAPDSQSRAR